jgi:hypothetical protein
LRERARTQSVGSTGSTNSTNAAAAPGNNDNNKLRSSRSISSDEQLSTAAPGAAALPNSSRESRTTLEGSLVLNNYYGVNNHTTSSQTAVVEDTEEELLAALQPRQRIPQVLMDDNLMEFTRGRPFPLKHRAKLFFHKAVQNDTLFLSIVNVVDYSILVGFDENKHEMVVGIIDYLRQVTDKTFLLCFLCYPFLSFIV